MERIEYRNGRFYRDGRPFFFLGAEYQYYRDQRAHWSDRLDQLKAAHVQVVCFYIPWRHHLVHDPATGDPGYDFDGRTLDSRDLRHFLRLCTDKGLYMLAKPGPFVHSELNIGGLPDLASPSFNPGIEPVRIHNGQPLYWEYDHTQLPSPDDPAYDALAREWLRQVGDVLRPHAAPEGRIIALQLNDETIYCTSNDAPWHYGYDAPQVRAFHRMIRHKYGTIERYNRVHGTEHRFFEAVQPPRPDPSRPVVRHRGEALALADWGEFQWRQRRDLYARYREALGVDLPYLSNFAGITPPIDENVPDQVEASTKDSPREYLHLYPEWWFAHNRVDQDRDVYHYGMISWLGVAAYNVPDARTPPEPDVGDNEVFHRYIHTARRRRGINVEENWGFATLYHPMSRYPVIPVFQTLASVAGGCTGYVVFTGVCHGYWLDDLDRTTQKQHRTFPSDAPIGENGETGPMYEAMALLNEWFAREGEAFLSAEIPMDLWFLIVPEHAAVSSWVPDGSPRHWQVPHAVPRVGAGVLEPAMGFCNLHGIQYGIAELPSLTLPDLLEKGRAAIPLAFFLSRRDQQILVDFVRQGGTLIASGELPLYDEEMAPCTIFRDFLRALQRGEEQPKGRLVYGTGNLFGDERAFLGFLRRAGWEPGIRYDPALRVYPYRDGRHRFLFFFHFGRDQRTCRVRLADPARDLEMELGGKASGVLHLELGDDASRDRLRSCLVKGVNEYEGRRGTFRLRIEGREVARLDGDGALYDL